VLKAEAERLHLGASELRFLGLRRDIPELLAATDIFALSSRDEGLGTSLLDATHSGCALVATAAGGIPEIVKDGQTGLLSPVGDASVFAEKLALALHRKDLRDQWVQAAQELATQRFSLSAMVAGNLQIYHQLVAQQ
jgi:glycosyltransferase involved in cell wall biosynthesis